MAIPLKIRLTSFIDTSVSNFTEELSEKYGFTFSYKSLSPSILTSFYVKGISIKNNDGRTVLVIDNIKVDYNIFKLIKMDLKNGIKGILIDGINLNINSLLELIPKSDKEKSPLNIKLADIMEIIPDNLKLKNLSFSYYHKQANIAYTIKNIAISGKSNNTAVELNVDSVLNVYVPAIKSNISCNLGAFGAITEDLNNSQLNLSFNDIVCGDIKMNKLNFHASFIDNILDLHTIQMTEPISVGAFYDVDSQDFSAQINTDKLSLGTVTNNFISNPTIDKFKNTKITTNTTVTSNFNDKSIKFYLNANVNIPENAIPGGLDVVFNVSGNENELSLKNLEVESKNLLVTADLDLKYKNMQLAGIIELPYFVLPNGNTISTELYLDSKEKGFTGFSPQIFVGSRALTGFSFSVLPQSDSIDFSIEMSDYSHVEETNPGIIKLDGSYLTKSKYLQSNVSLNTLYLDSLVKLGGEFLPADKYDSIMKIENTIAPYVFSGDVYFSTDFNSISYNVPYVLLANVKDENQVVMISLNGNEQSIQLNQLTLIFGSFGLQLAGFLDKNPDSSDIFFELDVTSSTIPYHVMGTIMPEVCTIMGDYGTNVELRFNDESIDGFVEINNLPILLKDKSIVISTFSDLFYNKIDGPRVGINRFEIELIDTKNPVNPRLSMSGNATKYGIQLDSVTYTDFYSALQGYTDIMIDFNNGILSSASINASLQNPLERESININGNIANPGYSTFSTNNLMNDFYIDIQTQVTDFNLDRFVSVQSDKNRATGSIYASGTIAHPYVTVSLDEFSMYAGASLLNASGNALLEDRDLSLIGMNVKYGNFNFDNLEAQASLEDFSLDATCDFSMGGSTKSIQTPISINVGNSIIPEGKMLPDTFSASINAEKIEGTLIKKSFPAQISIFHSPTGTSFLSSDNIGLSGFLSSDGILEANIDNGDFLEAKVDGFIAPNIANIQLYDLNFDLRSLYYYLNFDKTFIFEYGILEGEAVVTGSFSNPDINGDLHISSPKFQLPFITPEKVKTEEINLNIVNNVVEIPPFILKTKKGNRIETGFNIYLNKWGLDYIDGKIKTVEDDLFPGHLLMGVAKVEGDVSVDLDMLFQNSILELNGTVFGENVEVTSGLDSISNMLKNNIDKKDEEESKSKLMFKTDIDVILGTHASVAFAPILRCIFVPNTKFKVLMDQSTGSIGIDGEMKLRSGDIAYLNRSFYIKSGAIKFNTDDITNPLVTLVAEVRERDDQGTPVKIILDVENQHLLDLKPHFRSEPARSENEIQRMLGQIALADSENATDFIFAAGDYALQSTVIRQFENKLRDFLNFDIFSVRTNVLQNTLNMGFSGNLTKENLSIGNFLDNSTVYIGKYLGSNLYLDAMLHISFEHNNFTDIASAGSVLFQPELGLEMESPFANIRFNLAPDINALLKNNQFVPSTSVTLSWDFTF